MAHSTTDDNEISGQGTASRSQEIQKTAMLTGIGLAMALYLVVAAGIWSSEIVALAVAVAGIGIVAGTLSLVQMAT